MVVDTASAAGPLCFLLNSKLYLLTSPAAAARPHNSLEPAKHAPANAYDAADNEHVSMASLDRNLSGYSPPNITSDAGGLTPQLTSRTSISHISSLDYRNKQLALLGPMRPQPTKIWKRKFVKLMVVGDSGLGKTTLISALLSKPGEQLQVCGQCC